MKKIEKKEIELQDFMNELEATIKKMILEEPLRIPSNLDIPHRPKCLKEGCDGYLKPIKGKNGTFFKCLKCGTNFSQGSDGQPLPKKEFSGEIIEADCPLGCGRKARQYTGKWGKFWKCECSPDISFKDVDGKPVVREKRPTAPCPAPKCKGTAIQLNGKNGLFWKCPTCQNFFDDRDGKPILRESFKKDKNNKTGKK